MASMMRSMRLTHYGANSIRRRFEICSGLHDFAQTPISPPSVTDDPSDFTCGSRGHRLASLGRKFDLPTEIMILHKAPSLADDQAVPDLRAAGDAGPRTAQLSELWTLDGTHHPGSRVAALRRSSHARPSSTRNDPKTDGRSHRPRRPSSPLTP